MLLPVSQALAQLGWAEIRVRLPEGKDADEEEAGEKIEEDDAEVVPIAASSAEPAGKKKVKQPRSMLLQLSSYPSSTINLTGPPTALALPSAPLVWDVAWVDILSDAEYASVSRLQRVNQFPHCHKLSKKKFLALNLNAMRQEEAEEYAFYPRSWVVPQQWAELKHIFGGPAASESSAASSAAASSQVLIVKSDSACEGRGIYLVSSLDQIELNNPDGTTRNLVVQEYLPRPLTLGGNKFDLRLYILLLSLQPLSVALFDDGLVRVCTESYSEPTPAELGTPFAHLTNYAVQKTNAGKFVRNTDANQSDVGHKWSVQSLFAKLARERAGFDPQALWKSIADLVIKSILSAYGTLLHSYKTSGLSTGISDGDGGGAFQLLGFDVLLVEPPSSSSHATANPTPYLLEINRNCSLKTDSPLDQRIKVKVVSQVLQSVIASATSRRSYWHRCGC
jgi:tubulin polyglutamylase TTLL6/13